MVRILLEYKDILDIDVNETAGPLKKSAIHYAAENQFNELYNLLTEHEADTKLEDKNGSCAEDYLQPISIDLMNK